MKRGMLHSLSLGFVLVLSLGVVGCGDAGDDDDDGTGSKVLNAIVKDRMSRTPLGGRKVFAVDNDTGELIDGVQATSAANGSVSFRNLEGELSGFLVEAVEGEHVDTFQFNITTDGDGEELWAVDKATYELAPALAGITVDTTKGLMAGSLYFVNAAGEEEPVGCATVTVDPPSGEVRYFGANELPVDTTAAFPETGRDNTHPCNGLFLVANMTPGRTTLRFQVDGVEKGTVEVITFAGEDTLLISNIYADETLTTNPTSAACECAL